MSDHLETIRNELEDVLIRYLRALAPEQGADNQLEEIQDSVDSLESKVEDIENRLDDASVSIDI
tara:strand:- start:282 stop:473 length:192 start_codon:yes stop_codon:yes gene_type:complete